MKTSEKKVHDAVSFLATAQKTDYTIGALLRTHFFLNNSLCKKCTYSELFWTLFSRIRTDLSAFIPSAGKYRPEKLGIRRLLRSDYYFSKKSGTTSILERWKLISGKICLRFFKIVWLKWFPRICIILHDAILTH